MHSTSGSIRMFDHRGNSVNEKLDAKVEKEFNSLLDLVSKENEQRFKRIHKKTNIDDKYTLVSFADRKKNIHSNNNNNMMKNYRRHKKTNKRKLNKKISKFVVSDDDISSFTSTDEQLSSSFDSDGDIHESDILSFPNLSTNKNKKNKKMENNAKESVFKSFGDTLQHFLESPEFKLQSLNNSCTKKSKKKQMVKSIDEDNLWSWHFSNLEYSNATDLNTLSLTEWDQDDEYAFSGDHCLIKEGYGCIINGLVHNLDIKYNHIVTKIKYGNASGISVEVKINEREDMTNNNSELIADESSAVSSIDIHKNHKNAECDNVALYALVNNTSGQSLLKLNDIHGHLHLEDEINDEINGYSNHTQNDNSLKCFTADAVVITLPLGVLKNNDVQFEPLLPAWKQKAIDSLGFGLLNKVLYMY